MSDFIFVAYVYINRQPTENIQRKNTYYYHPDHLGTPQKMTDSSGVVRWSADYKPFGEAAIDTQVTTITNNLRFPGQYYDAETGLNYNYNRDYNPIIARYIETDPIGINKGVNHLFAYANNNPLSYFDKFGLFTYNKGPDKTGRLRPDIAAMVSFLEICLATDLDCYRWVGKWA